MIATDASGTALVAWPTPAINCTGGGANCPHVETSERRAGGSFGPPRQIPEAPRPTNGYDPVDDLDLDMDAAGNAVAVWRRQAGNDLYSTSGWVESATRPAGAEFGTSRLVSDANGINRRPRVALDGRGGAAAVWTDANSGRDDWGENPRRPVAVGTATGGLGPPRVLDRGDGEGEIAGAPGGGFVALWAGSRDVLAAVREPGGDFCVQSVSASESRSPLAPGVATTAGGESVAVWISGRRLNGDSTLTAAVGSPDARRPSLSGLSLSRRRFSVSRRSRAGARRGTSFRYRLSEPARLRVEIRRRTRRGGRARYRRVGEVAARGTTGANETPFSGRIRGRALPSGSYRAVLTARDCAGRRSGPRRVDFRVTAR